MFISTTLSDDVIQVSSAFYWNIIDAGDGYVYILFTDNTKAITITGTNDGDHLVVSDYIPGNEKQI